MKSTLSFLLLLLCSISMSFSMKITEKLNNHKSHLNSHSHSHSHQSFGSGKLCGRCGKTVYTNEEILAAGQSWHKKTCFKCKECNKSLDSFTIAVWTDPNGGKGEIYCKSCYASSFK